MRWLSELGSATALGASDQEVRTRLRALVPEFQPAQH
jgi:hypothetical protein